MIKGKPFLTASKAHEQAIRIFSTLGSPKDKVLDRYKKLPDWKKDFAGFKGQDLRKIFKVLDDTAFDLLEVRF